MKLYTDIQLYEDTKNYINEMNNSLLTSSFIKGSKNNIKYDESNYNINSGWYEDDLDSKQYNLYLIKLITDGINYKGSKILEGDSSNVNLMCPTLTLSRKDYQKEHTVKIKYESLEKFFKRLLTINYCEIDYDLIRRIITHLNIIIRHRILFDGSLDSPVKIRISSIISHVDKVIDKYIISEIIINNSNMDDNLSENIVSQKLHILYSMFIEQKEEKYIDTLKTYFTQLYEAKRITKNELDKKIEKIEQCENTLINLYDDIIVI